MYQWSSHLELSHIGSAKTKVLDGSGRPGGQWGQGSGCQEPGHPPAADQPGPDSQGLQAGGLEHQPPGRTPPTGNNRVLSLCPCRWTIVGAGPRGRQINFWRSGQGTTHGWCFRCLWRYDGRTAKTGPSPLNRPA